ncbi:MAG TPA: helix-turn-helix domain-containing protein [Myxococcota bacterium]|nr:helix-turn-helix domain-containing protein [Myxococcota bacterium]
MSRSIPGDRFHDLIDAATAVFLEQGYRRTQVADVAARMGLAKGSVYTYVESKEALFHAVVRHADRAQRLELPDVLPVATPPPGATLEEVRKRVAENRLPVLSEALDRRRVSDVRSELEAIVRELYGVLSRHRIAIKLLDRCAHDHPELAAVWYAAGREGALALLRRYLEDRIRRRRLAPSADPAVTARLVLETVVFWAVHRHWDPLPQAVDDQAAEAAVVEFVVRALVPA